MSFASAPFLVLFAAMLAAQLLVRPSRARQWILLAGSYVFYGWWDWRFCFLMFGLTLVAFLTGLGMARWPRRRRALCAAGVAAPLVVLGVFKYANFFVESFCAVFGIAQPGALNIILPVGISFYTFQSLSYTIDVYRGKLPVCRDLMRFSLYIAFFPQLVAGPIVKAADFLPQLEEDRRPTRAGVWAGLNLFAWGMFKKVVLADHLSVFVDQVFATPAAFDSLTVFLAVLSYAMQIYFDFSSYSDMAIGCARTLGYELQRNFDLPYVSRNVSEFWKRWHISLSSWLQQYLYIPLGGNRKGRARTYLNLMITMVLGGLWHGAGANFILWGALHGAALVVHKIWHRAHPNAHGGLRRWLSILATFAFVCLCWVFFRAQTLSQAAQVLQKLFVWTDGVRHLYSWSVFALLCLTGATAWCERFHRDQNGAVHGEMPRFRAGTFSGAFAMTLLVGLTLVLMYTGGNPFIYFQF